MTEQELEFNKMGFLYASWARYLSFLLGAVLSVVVLLLPQIIAKDTSELDHGSLSMIMLAMSGCFVHGVGYIPRNVIAKYLFSPYICWPIVAVALYTWFY